MTEQKKPATRIKNVSKWAIFVANIWLYGAAISKAFFDLKIEVREIIAVAIASVALWSPAFVSIIVDKFTVRLKDV